ncbi:GNAT family N-acetyltransferase [Undibacterium sp. RuTC16W]|uniref:GNAT family N-acetyltransferase n=1 Tax=Undibacterium sp. RuTC16W TaxID=3413048 RepID=UPI003BF3EAA2
MKGSHKISVESEPQPSDMHAVIKGLTEFNAQHTGGAVHQYLLVTVRDSEGALVGGLLGATYIGWLQVQAVWLSDSLRGQGYGRVLMKQAEDEALRRGCDRAHLETYSFQALSFYEKCGYSVVSRIPDFPKGGARYALTKTLTEVLPA